MATAILSTLLKVKPIRKQKIDENVIVSLTTFPTRINSVWLVITCLLRQTILPHKIILYLSKQQFSDIAIPENLSQLVGKHFEIKFVDGDIKSHKKYFYSLRDYPDKKIILVDDDIFYPSNMIADLLNTYNAYTEPVVICRYARKIKYLNNTLQPYKQWDRIQQIDPGFASDLIFFGSGGGTLLPPAQYFHPDIVNMELFLSLTPLADDIWLNAMCRRSNISVRMSEATNPMPIYIKNNISLFETNGAGENDRQIESVNNYYRSIGEENVF